MYAGQVARQVTDGADHGTGLHPALVLPVRGLQTARTPTAGLDLLPALPVLVASLVTPPAVTDLSHAPLSPLPGHAPLPTRRSPAPLDRRPLLLALVLAPLGQSVDVHVELGPPGAALVVHQVHGRRHLLNPPAPLLQVLLVAALEVTDLHDVHVEGFVRLSLVILGLLVNDSLAV